MQLNQNNDVWKLDRKKLSSLRKLSNYYSATSKVIRTTDKTTELLKYF